MPKYVKVQGTWKAVDESADCGKVKVNGVWRTVSNSYVKVAGVWKAVCSPVVTTATTTTTTTVTVPITTATTAQAYPNIGTVIAYGAGAGQAWTSNAAYITWGGSGWGSYTVIASNGSSSNSPSSAGGPPVLLTGFSASTSYSVTVTLYANANYSGQSASSSTTFTTGAATTATTTTTTTAIPNCGIMPDVVGLTESEASNAITARGIAYEFTYYTSVGATAQNTGRVQSQDPAANTNVGSCNYGYNAAITLYQYTATTTTTTAPVVNPGTVYLSYCFAGQPYVESFPIDANNVVTQDVSQACSAYTNLFGGLGATSISCSTVSARTAPTGCSTATTTTTTTTATTTTPTSCTMPSVVGLSEGSASTAITNAGIAYEFTYYYGNAQGATAQNNGTVAAQDPAPGSVGSCGYTVNAALYIYSYTAPVTTSTTAQVTYYIGTSGCRGTSGEYSSAPSVSGPFTGASIPSDTSSFANNISTKTVYRSTSAAALEAARNSNCEIAQTTTTTTTTTAAVNCNTCNSYNPSDGSYTLTRSDGGCPSGSRYYRTCITPGSCPNIDQDGSCVPATTTSTVTTTTNCNSCDPNLSSTGTRSVSTSICASGIMTTYTCWTPAGCPNVTSDTGCQPVTTTTTTAASTTYCPSLGYSVPTSGYPGNCPGAGGGGTTSTTTTSSAAATGRRCSQSDYNNQCCSCFSVNACDTNGSGAVCTL
jgi:beta-lactam-binding protein with PASTA domain